MLQTLLTNRGKADKSEIAKVLLSHDRSQTEYYEQVVNNMVGKVLRNHGIVKKHGSEYEVVDHDQLTPSEKDELVELCQAKLDDFLGQRGNSVYQHRSRHREAVSGSMRYRMLMRAKHRCELCGISANDRALDIDHIVPKSKGGADTESNFQVLCSLCNQNKNNTDDTDFRDWSSFYNARDADCLFCNEAEGRSIGSNELALAFEDAYAVTVGHTLIIPRRHVADYFDLEQPELNAIQQLMRSRRRKLISSDPSITGFNVGINAGRAAGQTMFHCHVHLIPRRDGDVENPRGGVRGVIPSKQSY